MAFISLFLLMLKAAFTCNHTQAKAVEGKTFCPDCGHGVVFRWVVLRCLGCGQRRPSRYQFRQVVPAETCCTYCGDTTIETEQLSDPELFQLRYALLRFETEPSEIAFWSQFSVSLKAFVQESLKPMTPAYPQLTSH